MTVHLPLSAHASALLVDRAITVLCESRRADAGINGNRDATRDSLQNPPESEWFLPPPPPTTVRLRTGRAITRGGSPTAEDKDWRDGRRPKASPLPLRQSAMVGPARDGAARLGW